MNPNDERIQVALETLLDEHPPGGCDAASFWGAQFDAGLAWPHFPEGEGGLGLVDYDEGGLLTALSSAGAPLHEPKSLIALGMAAPTVAAHGSRELRRRHLRAVFTGEEVWCQLFSEPGAGSDLAGLATTAQKVDGGWVLNGQKVWTSFAHLAAWGMLLARTDPDVPKHRGLSYFVLDMGAPGVDIRPLFQITGEAEFNEVYLNDVFVPDTHLLGDPGDGWTVAMTTLMNERATLASNADNPTDPAVAALRLWRERAWKDPVLQDRLVSIWTRSELMKLTRRRALETGSRGTPGPEGSIGKVLWAEYMKDASDLCVDLMGHDAVAYPPGYPLERADIPHDSSSDLRWLYLRSRATTIEGGTSEVMRNIIAERVLGLPGEPRLDKDRAWREVPRG